MEALRDDELLKYVGRRLSDDDAEAQAAFVILHRRHAHWVFGSLVNLTKNHAVAKDIASRVFEKVWKKAKSIEIPAGKESDSSRFFGAWVKITALRAYHDYVKSMPIGEVLMPDFETNEEVVKQVECMSKPAKEDVPQNDLSSENNRMISEALKTLTPKEEHVVMLTLSLRGVGKRHLRLSNKQSAELANKLNTTPENLRQLRSRGMRKLNTYCVQKKLKRGNNTYEI